MGGRRTSHLSYLLWMVSWFVFFLLPLLPHSIWHRLLCPISEDLSLLSVWIWKKLLFFFSVFFLLSLSQLSSDNSNSSQNSHNETRRLGSEIPEMGTWPISKAEDLVTSGILNSANKPNYVPQIMVFGVALEPLQHAGRWSMSFGKKLWSPISLLPCPNLPWRPYAWCLSVSVIDFFF